MRYHTCDFENRRYFTNLARREASVGARIVVNASSELKRIKIEVNQKRIRERNPPLTARELGVNVSDSWHVLATVKRKLARTEY